MKESHWSVFWNSLHPDGNISGRSIQPSKCKYFLLVLTFILKFLWIRFLMQTVNTSGSACLNVWGCLWCKLVGGLVSFLHFDLLGMGLSVFFIMMIFDDCMVDFLFILDNVSLHFQRWPYLNIHLIYILPHVSRTHQGYDKKSDADLLLMISFLLLSVYMFVLCCAGMYKKYIQWSSDDFKVNWLNYVVYPVFIRQTDNVGWCRMMSDDVGWCRKMSDNVG